MKVNRCFFAMTNFHYFVLLCLIPRFSCTPQPLADTKEHNEIYFTLKEVVTEDGPGVKLVDYSLRENDAGLHEDKIIFDEVKPDFAETHTSEKTDIGGLGRATPAEGKEAEIYKKNFENLSLIHVGKNTGKDENISEENTNADLLTDSLPLSRTIVLQAHKQDGHLRRHTDGLRLKKQIQNVKYSEPRPFQYIIHNPFTGAYRFGYGTQNQYREEVRTEDGTVSGSYGWRDSNGKWHETNFVADKFGYRITPPNQQIGPPLIIPPSNPTLPSYGTFDNRSRNRYQPINPYQSQEFSSHGSGKKSFKDDEIQDESLDPFHSFDFSAANKQSLWSDSLRLPQKADGGESNLLGGNEFKFLFNPPSKEPIISYSLPSKNPEDLKVTKEETITVANLQDHFFYGLPLKPIRSSLLPNFGKSPETVSPEDYTLLSRRRVRPAKVERVSKPLRQRHRNRDRSMRAKSMDGDGVRKDYTQIDENGKTKTERSTYNYLVSKHQNNLAYYTKLPKNSGVRKLYHHPSTESSRMLIQSREWDEKNLPSHKPNFRHQNENINSLALSESSEYIGPYFRPIIFPIILPSYQPNIFIPSSVETNSISTSVVPAYKVKFYPLTKKTNYKTFSNYHKKLFDSFYRPYNLPTYPIFILGIYTSGIIRPMNYSQEWGQPLPQTIKTNSTKYPDNEASEHSVDYLLLSDEFQDVNGSITNDPAFGNIQDHLLNKTNKNSFELQSQDKPDPLDHVTNRPVIINGTNLEGFSSTEVTNTHSSGNKTSEKFKIASFLFLNENNEKRLKPNLSQFFRVHHQSGKQKKRSETIQTFPK